MKIFISHSSQDKWIARRISQDLQAVGAETFLDEKDIQTGDLIDSAIQDHLRDCDEILMLLSPTALASHWVLLEIGGAKALGKRLVPILLHISPNDLPTPLSNELARDLNDIQRYYDEVGRRVEDPDIETEPVEPRPAPDEVTARPRPEYAVGDRVKIPEQPQPVFTSQAGHPISWNDSMTAHAGKIATVTGIRSVDAVALDVDNGLWWWVTDWLEPAQSAWRRGHRHTRRPSEGYNRT